MEPGRAGACVRLAITTNSAEVDLIDIAICGAGGFAREVAWLLASLQESYNFVGYVEEELSCGGTLHGAPVMSWGCFRDRYPHGAAIVAVGDPTTREKAVQACAGARFATLEHPTVERSSMNVRIGEGSIICCGSILTVDIDIGRHVQVNLHCTIGHDVHIGDYSTLSPGVHVSGNVHIGRSVYVGTGAAIINGTPTKPLVIGDGAVIGAGAVVIGNVERNCLYAGVPAVLKKKYLRDRTVL